MSYTLAALTDLVQWMMNDKIEFVTTRFHTVSVFDNAAAGIDAFMENDFASIHFRTAAGTAGIIDISMAERHTQPVFVVEVDCERAKLTFQDNLLTESLLDDGELVEISVCQENPQNTPVPLHCLGAVQQRWLEKLAEKLKMGSCTMPMESATLGDGYYTTKYVDAIRRQRLMNQFHITNVNELLCTSTKMIKAMNEEIEKMKF